MASLYTGYVVQMYLYTGLPIVPYVCVGFGKLKYINRFKYIIMMEYTHFEYFRVNRLDQFRRFYFVSSVKG